MSIHAVSKGSMRFKKQFTAELKDPTSKEYKMFEEEFIDMVRNGKFS